MNLGDKIQGARLRLNLSQMALASISGVSLPSIQRIELNRANPSLQTLEKLFEALGFQLELVPKSIDWDLLAALGVPLSVKDLKPVRRMPSVLVRGLAEALKSFDLGGDFATREGEALLATALVLKIHYPNLFSELELRFPPIESILKSAPFGRILKLYRISKSQLGTYL